jgi:AcrR family transcriptional regulator
MPPKPIFTRDEIVELAFQLVRQHGMKKLSARAIARELKSSTMPIYSSVSSMKALEREVHEKFRGLFLQYATKPWTDNALLDISFGFIRLAKDEKQLFRIMFATDDATEVAWYKEEKKIVEPILLERVKAQLEFHTFTDEQIQYLMNFMGIFMQGLASLVNDGRLDDDSDDQILTILKEAYNAFMQQAKSLPSRSPNSKED